MGVATILAMGFVCMACFMLGVKVGQAVKKDEEIKLPSVNPVEAVKEYINKREAKIEQDKIDKIMQNIERYDGTSNGQIDVG